MAIDAIKFISFSFIIFFLQQHGSMLARRSVLLPSRPTLSTDPQHVPRLAFAQRIPGAEVDAEQVELDGHSTFPSGRTIVTGLPIVRAWRTVIQLPERTTSRSAGHAIRRSQSRAMMRLRFSGGSGS